MIGVLIITHESLGAAYTQLAHHFFGRSDFAHIKILNVETHEQHADIIARVKQMLPEINQGKGVLILTDIFGATPCNAALKMVVPQQSAMLTGLNAPMLIKAVSHADHCDDLTQFAQIVRDAGLQGIMLFNEPVQAT